MDLSSFKKAEMPRFVAMMYFSGSFHSSLKTLCMMPKYSRKAPRYSFGEFFGYYFRKNLSRAY